MEHDNNTIALTSSLCEFHYGVDTTNTTAKIKAKTNKNDNSKEITTYSNIIIVKKKKKAAGFYFESIQSTSRACFSLLKICEVESGKKKAGSAFFSLSLSSAHQKKKK